MTGSGSERPSAGFAAGLGADPVGFGVVNRVFLGSPTT